jgi:hypothetical protein
VSLLLEEDFEGSAYIPAAEGLRRPFSKREKALQAPALDGRRQVALHTVRAGVGAA